MNAENARIVRLVLLVTEVALVIAHPFARFNPNSRIVGGDTTSIARVPYQVSIQIDGDHNCGGSIISKDWVITAAHCVDPDTNYTIRAGSNNHEDGGSIHPMAEYKVHERYILDFDGLPVNDIALIRVEVPFEFDDNVQAIEMYNQGEAAVVGSVGVVTGWGEMGEKVPAKGEENLLQIVEVPITSKHSCFTGVTRVPRGQICAGYPEGGKDACGGDSGGPLAIDGRLAGIVSWGLECAQPGYPGVYTEVAYYRRWIRNKSGI